MSNSSDTTQRDLLSVTAFFSALLHAIIILAITFKIPDIGSAPSTDNTLDVVIINSSNNQEAKNAELISSSDNAGGGEDDQEAESRMDWKPTNPSVIQSAEKIAKQRQLTTLTPDQFITAEEGELSLSRPAPDPTELENKQKTDGPDKFTTNARQLERERLLAKISQTELDYNKRPKKEYLSPTTKSNGAAKYLDKWRKKLVQVGNRNYPIQIKAKELKDTLIVSVEIKRNGTINKIKIIKKSKHKLLNDAALRIIRDASPFEAFPDEDYFKTFDILVITRSIHFLPNNTFNSTSASL
jgi:protein TonB